ncbi:MAG: FAD-dependent oxidoreductase [Alphaproteobacteria bacterium]|nr:MAG: FAD-dependent oxidoreductase [Alphaproteobacteria bacterium]
MKTHARVVVIGGGIAGCSTLYHLAALGWRDVVLVERGELTEGSTWHAAGNCPNFSTSWSILKLQRYSTALYARLGETTGYPINYHVTGSIRLAHTPARMDELRHVCAMARAQGIDFEMLSPAEIRDRYPFIELHDLEGGLWDPGDGDIDPSQVTQAFAAGARAHGAEIYRHNPVEAITRTPGGEWQVHTRNGTITAEIVVNAAGYRGAEVGRMVGLDLPIVSLQHQYLVTEPIPELVCRDAKLPLLRDPDESYYLRQERGGLLLGPYERDATPVWQDGIPPDFGMELFADDLDRLEPYIEGAIARVPILGSAGIQRVINGPIPYTPDGLPLIGLAYGLDNFHLCCAFSFGIVQGGGAGKIAAEIIAAGEAEWDTWPVDPRRFTDYATKAYTVARAVELYQREYDIAFPVEERPAGRPAKTTPLYDRLKAKGAAFGARGGWERATWFPPEGMSADPPPTFRRPGWFAAVGAECRAVRERVGVLDLGGFAKFEISGPGAGAFLDRLVAGRLPREGRIALSYFCTPRGRLLSEMTITRLGSERFYLCSAASAEWHDHQWLMQHLPTDGGVSIANVTGRYGTLIMAGPRARAVLARITDAGLDNDDFPWLSARTITIGYTRVRALRVNYVGELGWELHVPVENMVALYEAIMRAGTAEGIVDFGMYALDSLRLEKCYRAWKIDLTSDYTPLEAALERFVDLDKPDFIGREALRRQREAGVSQRLVPLVVDADDADAPPCAPVWYGDERVGLVTSGGFGHAIGRSIALAYLDRALATPGRRVEVEILGARRAAEVTAEPIYDPANERLRA